MQETYTSVTLIDLDVFICFVFDTVHNSSFLLLIHKSYNIPIIPLEIPIIKKFGHIRVPCVLLENIFFIYFCMVYVMNCPCNIILTL